MNPILSHILIKVYICIRFKLINWEQWQVVMCGQFIDGDKIGSSDECVVGC